MDILKAYVESFNSTDEEIYKNLVDNTAAYEWLKEEIPLFECPDKDLERTYYFRFWTLRKHLKQTEDGYVITEFLPKVWWSGKHNTIVAAAGHHIYEGRWLKNSARYLGDYIRFFLNTADHAHNYSTWLAYATWQFVNATGDTNFATELLPSLCRYYEKWEQTHGLPNGMFWSYDGPDAMEFSISGTNEEHRSRKGIRPTLNSYLCADAFAIASLARLCGDELTAETYTRKYERLRALINSELFEDGFYRAYHYDDDADLRSVIANGRGSSPREELGFIPWMFNLPEKGRESVFSLLWDKKVFYTDFGIATADRSHPRFLYEAKHECLWNGYVWPFATSQTLYALMNAIDHYGCDTHKPHFCDLLLQYARSHVRTKEDGSIVPWIDEVRHPLRDEWSSRILLKDWGWQEGKGGYERGKDYNHSTFCDLVICGIVGVKVDGPELIVKPCIPEGWDYFRLRGLRFRGKTYDITYDRTGTKFNAAPGLTVTCRS